MGTPSDENVTKTETNKTKNSDSTVGKERPTEDGELRDDNEDSNKGDEEDVPDDFFDDFSNQDFINGLDIVDAWEEVEKSKPKEETENEEKLKQRKRSKEPKSHGRKSRSAERGKRKRSEEKRRRSRERRPRENSFQSKRIPNERELRRDPVKTKRDVDKDRENYTKKQEQKLISKVVETGLVPPGMETEVNLSEIESTTKQEDKERDVLKREIVLKHSKEKESRDKSRERRRRRSKSFEKVSSTHRGRSRGRSSERRRGRSRGRQDRSREKLRWNRSRERYFGRDREVSPFSPLSRRRRSRSLSDRERWLKLRKSPSIERKYRGGIGEERMSFLEEIKMKLDGHSTNRSPVDYFPPTNYIQPVHNIYPTEPIQVAAPAPNQFFPPNPNSPYDQNFFIGDPKPVPPINSNSLNMPSQINGVPPAVLQPSPVQAPVLPTLQHIGSSFGPPSVDFGFTTQPVKPVPPPNPSTSGINNVSKLLEQIRASTNAKVNMQGNTFPILEDKKLSFTDFLSNNSRVSAFSSDSEALQKKVNGKFLLPFLFQLYEII
ncbi:hypothetical protein HHI36_011301 [Cryptolaemus montrouzieri]|uniref:Uncharacterized protein n=1 Tax=Cryptolaemus montrouzieri TaxID=559131 RepID=A0ABD2MLD4_9CUCU